MRSALRRVRRASGAARGSEVVPRQPELADLAAPRVGAAPPRVLEHAPQPPGVAGEGGPRGRRGPQGRRRQVNDFEVLQDAQRLVEEARGAGDAYACHADHHGPATFCLPRIAATTALARRSTTSSVTALSLPTSAAAAVTISRQLGVVRDPLSRLVARVFAGSGVVIGHVSRGAARRLDDGHGLALGVAHAGLQALLELEQAREPVVDALGGLGVPHGGSSIRTR